MVFATACGGRGCFYDDSADLPRWRAVKGEGGVEQRLIERALNHTGGDKLEAIKLLGANPATFRSTAALELLDLETKQGVPEAIDSLIQPGMTMEEIEREAIRRALTQTKGRRTDAAQLLGLSVRTLQRKIKEFDLDL